MAIQKCATRTANDVVIRLLDERDPDDQKQITREKVADYWQDMNALARKSYQDAEAERAFAKTAHAARATLLDRLAVSSPGAGEFAPPVQLHRLRSGYLWPV